MIKDNSTAENLFVQNVGIVLLNNYFPILFNRVALIQDDQFVSSKAQNDAIYYLQYLAKGVNDSLESSLALNKILCGLSPETPIKSPLIIPEDHAAIIEGLIKASIEHWTVIGQSSNDGFRGNWLVRDGYLRGSDQQWSLTVEKRSYDLLIDRSPFSFSIIKFPWMPKPLHVEWLF